MKKSLASSPVLEEAMEDIRNIIEIKNVTKDYGDFKLDNISFEVPEGSICGFIGQNGAGKTTTIKAILDVINVDAGEIFVFGQNIKTDSVKLREDIGVVFGNRSALWWDVPVEDSFELIKSIYKIPDEYDALLVQWPLTNRLAFRNLVYIRSRYFLQMAKTGLHSGRNASPVDYHPVW